MKMVVAWREWRGRGRFKGPGKEDTDVPDRPKGEAERPEA